MKQQQRLLNNSFGIFLGVLFFLLLAVSVLGDCPLGQTDNLCFDPGNPALFDYLNGDYSTITDAGWETFVQSNVPVSRVSEIPADKLKYSDLDAQQRKAMTAGQIARNLDNIFDIANDVNSNKAEEAITQMYHQTVDLSKAVGKGKVILKVDGQFETDGPFRTDGDFKNYFKMKNYVYLKSNEFRAGKLVVTEEGQINFVPSARDFHLPERGIFNVDLTKRIHTYKGLEMSNGFLYVELNRPLIYPEKSLQVEGLVITGGIPTGTTLYFDGYPHADASESYVSLDKKERRLAMNLQYNSVKFLPGNLFLHVEKGDKVKVTAPSGGGDIEIDSYSADYHGKIIPQIPEMRIKPAGDVVVENGPNTFTVNQGGIFHRVNMNSRYFEVGSSAFTIINDEGEKKGRRVIMDETGHYLILAKNVFNPLYETPAGTIDLTQNAQLQHDASVVFRRNSDAKVIQLGRTDAFGQTTYDADPLVLIQLSRALRDMPPALKGETDTIIVYPNEKMLQEYCGDNAAACATSERIISIQPGQMDSYIIHHEFAHNWLKDVHMQNAWYNLAHIPSETNPSREDPYGKDLGPKITGDKAKYGNANSWADGKNDPRYGCVRAYGCNNYGEDFATHAECAVQGPNCWKPLLDSEKNKWSEIHYFKFAFQCDHKLIKASTCKEMGVQ